MLDKFTVKDILGIILGVGILNTGLMIFILIKMSFIEIYTRGCNK